MQMRGTPEDCALRPCGKEQGIFLCASHPPLLLFHSHVHRKYLLQSYVAPFLVLSVTLSSPGDKNQSSYFHDNYKCVHDKCDLLFFPIKTFEDCKVVSFTIKSFKAHLNMTYLLFFRHGYFTKLDAV